MNKELCKKCFKQESISFNLVTSYVPFIGLNNGDGHVVVFDERKTQYCCKSACFRKGVIIDCFYKSQKHFDCVELLEQTCPYWLEHQMYDWNKE